MKKILLSVLCLCALCTAALFLNSKAESTLLNEIKTCSADTGQKNEMVVLMKEFIC